MKGPYDDCGLSRIDKLIRNLEDHIEFVVYPLQNVKKRFFTGALLVLRSVACQQILADQALPDNTSAPANLNSFIPEYSKSMWIPHAFLLAKMSN